jgi:type IX secretion system PorP/SprF family membrane protein
MTKNFPHFFIPIRLHVWGVCLLLCFGSSKVHAQDPHLSQFFANRIYLNPAFTGIEEGLQVTTSVRNQWYAADKGYSFATVAAEWQEPCWRSAFGLMLTHSREGFAPLVSSGANLTYSYLVPLRNGNVHFGLQYAFNQKSLDWDGLTFSDQLDPVFGNIYATAAPFAGRESSSFHDFGFGTVYRWDTKIKSNGSSLRSFRSHIGLSINHLASFLGRGPDESFLKTGAEVPARITLHGGTIIPFTFLRGVGNKLIVSPNFRFESQGASALNFNKSLTQFSGGLYIIFLNQFTTGMLYHSRSSFSGSKHTNTVTFSGGFSSQPQGDSKNSFYIGLSVDVNASGLGVRSNNTYELNFRYAFKGVRTFCQRGHTSNKYKRNESMPCPHFAY